MQNVAKEVKCKKKRVEQAPLAAEWNAEASLFFACGVTTFETIEYVENESRDVP